MVEVMAAVRVAAARAAVAREGAMGAAERVAVAMVGETAVAATVAAERVGVLVEAVRVAMARAQRRRQCVGRSRRSHPRFQRSTRRP